MKDLFVMVDDDMHCYLVFTCVCLCVCCTKGHEDAHIDPWEDPSFDIYHTTDRYGFIQYVSEACLHL